MPDTMKVRAHSGDPIGAAAGQQSEAERRALEFLSKVVRVRGVRINRDEFLR